MRRSHIYPCFPLMKSINTFTLHSRSARSILSTQQQRFSTSAGAIAICTALHSIRLYTLKLPFTPLESQRVWIEMKGRVNVSVCVHNVNWHVAWYMKHHHSPLKPHGSVWCVMKYLREAVSTQRETCNSLQRDLFLSFACFPIWWPHFIKSQNLCTCTKGRFHRRTH